MILQDEIAEGVYERLQVIGEPRRLPGIIERESRSELPSALVRLLAMTTAARFEDNVPCIWVQLGLRQVPIRIDKGPNQSEFRGG